jgi:hypothetical protein
VGTRHWWTTAHNRTRGWPRTGSSARWLWVSKAPAGLKAIAMSGDILPIMPRRRVVLLISPRLHQGHPPAICQLPVLGGRLCFGFAIAARQARPDLAHLKHISRFSRSSSLT